MSKVLKRLYLGDVVKSFGTKQLRKLTTEKPQEDSIVGTWVFKDTISLDGFPNFSASSYGATKNTFSINFNSNSGGYPYSFTSFQTARPNTSSPYELLYSGSVVWKGTSYTSLTVNTSGGYTDLWKTVVFTEEVTDETFITWLKANATKQ